MVDVVEADEVEADEEDDDDFFRFFPLLGLFFISLSCFFLALVSAAMSALTCLIAASGPFEILVA